ncbi:MAG TPA: hypothetical protein VGO07_04885 [Candidatus Saccharimonadales bacterium]|jgi:hypothetical protein|nr:hypothetical protein [Candidatus Saccharimonadales bacterium]
MSEQPVATIDPQQELGDPAMIAFAAEQARLEEPLNAGELSQYSSFLKDDLQEPDWSEEQRQSGEATLDALQSTIAAKQAENPDVDPDDIITAQLEQLLSAPDSGTAEEREMRARQTTLLLKLGGMLRDPMSRAGMRLSVDEWESRSQEGPVPLAEEYAGRHQAEPGEETVADAHQEAEAVEESIVEPAAGGLDAEMLAAAKELVDGIKVSRTFSQPETAAESTADLDPKAQKLQEKAEALMSEAKTPAEREALEKKRQELVGAAFAKPNPDEKWTDDQWMARHNARYDYNRLGEQLRGAEFQTDNIDELSQVLTQAGFAPESVTTVVGEAREGSEGHPDAIFSVIAQRNEDGTTTPILKVARYTKR